MIARSVTGLRERAGSLGAASRLSVVPLCLAAVAYALALAQRPGLIAADTKIDLHTDPVGFLGDVASVWSASGGLGQVQAGQYSGYLFPMGPFFALGDLLGMAPWLVHRLWLGTLLALAAWGAVRLLDALGVRSRVAHAVAGAAMVLNPYVVVFADRTSVTLLGYAALPWLLACVHRGLHGRGRWLWPAGFALVLAASGGGVNAAVTGWLLLGPMLLCAYEVAWGGVRMPSAAAFAARTGLLCVLASLWWIVPVVAHARYGLNFLPFTESAGAIWDTTSMSEGFRLMGYWIVYLGTGYGERLVPYFGSADTLLFAAPVLIATCALPALAAAGFAAARRWRYAPFLAAMTLLGLLVMSAGFPQGAPLRRALTLVYGEVEAVQFLRTTYKAGPLAALGMACLAGAGAAALWSRLAGRMPLRLVAGAGLAAVLVVAAWPLVAGRAVDEQIAFERVPPAWQRAAADLDRELAPNSRALVLPGQLFAFYEWGATQDPILPALSQRPVSVRSAVPFADLHAADMLVTLDSLVQQRRLLDGQLGPLLDLMAVGAVITGTDDDRRRSGSVAPLAAAQVLSSDRALNGRVRGYGPVRVFDAPPDELAPAQSLPQVRRVEVTGGRGLVRVEPLGPETVVDGSAEGIAALAAFDALPADRPLIYAGDREPDELRRAAAGGAEVVITDSNRRRSFLSSRVRQSTGHVLAAGDDPPADAAFLNPFAGLGTAAQTVAVYSGARYLDAPWSPNFPQFPEHRPYAAFDGDPSTYWLADRYLARERRWLEIGFERPRDVTEVELLPQRETSTRVSEVEIAGRLYPIEPGWNRLPVDLRRVDRLRVRITGLEGPEDRFRGPGAIAELRVPGLTVRERLRPPVLAERALSGQDLRRAALSYLFARVTGDDPLRRSRAPDPDRGLVPRGTNQEAALTAEPGDGEAGIVRTFAPPAARSYSASALVLADPNAEDSRLDRLAGYEGSAVFTSSGRFQGRPSRRASRAFDGDPSTAWVGQGPGASRPAWLGLRLPRPLELSELTLEPPSESVGVADLVRVRWRGGRSGALRVSEDGRVVLARPVRARAFRIEVLRARRPAGQTGALRDAVGIAEVRAPGLARVAVRRSGPLRAPCGTVTATVDGRAVAMRVRGDVAALDAGRPLRATSCRRVALGEGRAELAMEPGPLRADLLRLRSPAPEDAAPVRGGGRLLDPGRRDRGSYDGVRVDLSGPSWLVLGESYNAGWRAWCDGESLGAPEVVDGYANGWRAPASCRDVRLAFAPNRAAAWSYWISGVAVLAMLGLMAASRLRRRRARVPGVPSRAADRAAATPLRKPGVPAPWPARHALTAGVLLALPAAALFSIRAGVVIGPALALVLWRGLGARALALGAAALLGVVLPILQLALLPDDLGGFNSEYPLDLIAAHWVGVGAWVLLAAALWRALPAPGLSTASRPTDGPASARRVEAAPPGPP